MDRGQVAKGRHCLLRDAEKGKKPLEANPSTLCPEYVLKFSIILPYELLWSKLPPSLTSYLVPCLLCCLLPLTVFFVDQAESSF